MLAGLYEALADECSLLDRWPEAEQALRAALALRRELGDHLARGQGPEMLSGTQWQRRRGEESAQDAKEAVHGRCRPGRSWPGLYGERRHQLGGAWRSRMSAFARPKQGARPR